MSVGLGRIERRVLKVLEWHREWRRVNASFFARCDKADVLAVTDLAWDVQYGCFEDPPDGLPSAPSPAIYQSVCRAVRSLERKGLVKSTKNLTFWEDGWWSKTVTLVDSRTKHLDTVKTNIGVNA